MSAQPQESAGPETTIDAAWESDPRAAARALIAGWRAARDAFDRELLESRAKAERMLADVEAWASGGELSTYARGFVAVARAEGSAMPGDGPPVGAFEAWTLAITLDDFPGELAKRADGYRFGSEATVDALYERVCDSFGDGDGPGSKPSQAVIAAAETAILRALSGRA